MEKVLIVEDDLIGALLLKRTLTKAGYSVVVAENGNEGIELLKRESFNAVLTDWMMPQTDGIELIRFIRKKVSPLPYIMLITALTSKDSMQYALDSGADDFITKPVDTNDVLNLLKDGLARNKQQSAPPPSKVTIVPKDINVKPPHVCVAIASSTGGPPTLLHLFKNLEWKNNAAFLIVQHGPAWMLETFSERLRKESNLPVHLVTNRNIIESGNVYLAPGDKHIRVDKSSYHVLIDEGPKENFVRPAADPLFRSVAEAYGKYSIAVVLTGLGRDGAQGAVRIASVNGTILVQDPTTCIAPSMPKATIETGIPSRIIHYDNLSKGLSEAIFPIYASLKKTFR